MRRMILYLACVIAVGCGQQPGPAPKTQSSDDPKLAAIKASVAKTTPEGKAVIDKIQGMKPEVNSQPSAKPLRDIVEDFSKNKAQYNITPIGWEATQKVKRAEEKAGRWKVLFHYQDFQKQYLMAEWEYNPETDKLYPFDTKNAAEFWTGIGAEKGTEAQKAKK
jgi:hypothetical protein